MTRVCWTRRELLTALGATALLPSACSESADPRRPAVFPEPRYTPGGPLPWRNWAGNQACLPSGRLTPRSEDELAAALARTRGPLRPVGAGHSFSPLVPTDGTVVSLDLLSGITDVDAERQEAEAFGGTRLFELGPALWQRGQAMHNLPDIDQQALAGAMATSTHGTGAALGSLSASVRALTLVTADGRVLRCSRDERPELLQAASTSLGALGVVTRVRISTRPAYRLRMQMRVRRTDEILDDIARLKQHRHFEFFVIPYSSYSLEMTADESDAPDSVNEPEDPSAVEQLAALHERLSWLPGLGRLIYDGMIESSFEARERIGASYSVLTNLRVVRFNEMEYTVPAEAGPDCLREVLSAIERLPRPASWPLEYRYVRADDLWLSPFYQRDGCSISLHQPIARDYRPFFDAIEPIFWKYAGRPHWGKLHSLDAGRLAELYPRWPAFQELRREIDPEGRFLNPHLRRVFGVPG